MSEHAVAGAPDVRLLIIYKHAFLRDLVTRVLDDEGVDVVAAVRPEDYSPFLVDALKPQVIVVDRAALDAGSDFDPATVLIAAPGAPLSVVVVSLSDTSMLVWRKQVVANADVRKLISAVRESPIAATVSSSSL